MNNAKNMWQSNGNSSNAQNSNSTTTQFMTTKPARCNLRATHVNLRATYVQLACNLRATCVQHTCNIRALTCNVRATYVQLTCNFMQLFRHWCLFWWMICVVVCRCVCVCVLLWDGVFYEPIAFSMKLLYFKYAQINMLLGDCHSMNAGRLPLHDCHQLAHFEKLLIQLSFPQSTSELSNCRPGKTHMFIHTLTHM